MIFAKMEKSTFDKNGIKRHEVDSEFLTLISFQSVCDIQTGLSGENEAGVNLLPMTSTFYKANTLSVAVFKYFSNVNGFLVFSHFKKQNSTCLQQDQKSTSGLKYTCEYCQITKLTILLLVLTF